MTKKSKDSTAPNTTGERTRTAKELLARSKARMAKPGDPIFDLGWIVGERRSTPLSKRSQATKEPKPKISETTPPQGAGSSNGGSWLPIIKPLTNSNH